MAVLVYKYGCPSWMDLDEDGIGQLRLVHELRNELVAIERRYSDAMAALWLLVPEVADAQSARDAAAAEVEAAAAEVAAHRVVDRSTVPRVRDAERLKAAKAALDEARGVWRDAKKRNRKRMKAEPARVALDEAKRWASSYKRLYADWVQTRGMGHGSFSDLVWDKFPIARKRMIKERMDGRPSALHPRPWSGQGTLTARTQGHRWDGQCGQSSRGAPVFEIAEGRPRSEWLCRPSRRPEKLGETRRTLRLRVGRARGFTPLLIELPIVYDRPLPEDVPVKSVRVTRRLIAGKPRLSVTITVEVPDPEPAVGDGLAVRFGWRTVAGGGVRVATILGSRPLPSPPDSIADLVTIRDDGAAELHASSEWRHLLQRDADIRSIRDGLVEELRPQVVDALDDPVLVEQVGASAADVSRWRSPGRFVRLARVWPDDKVGAVLEEWRQRDRHLWCFEANERDQVIARRRDAWRCAAAWICDAAGTVVLHGLDLAELRRAPEVGREDTHEARGGRAQAQWAAPGDLRDAIEQAAKRRGVNVMYASEDKQQKGSET